MIFAKPAFGAIEQAMETKNLLFLCIVKEKVVFLRPQNNSIYY